MILPLPWYFNHAMAIQLAAAMTARTRAIVTISPNNPSGVAIPASVLKAINRLGERHGLFHISDEAYAEFVRGEVPHWSPGPAKVSAWLPPRAGRCCASSRNAGCKGAR